MANTNIVYRVCSKENVNREFRLAVLLANTFLLWFKCWQCKCCLKKNWILSHRIEIAVGSRQYVPSVTILVFHPTISKCRSFSAQLLHIKSVWVTKILEKKMLYYVAACNIKRVSPFTHFGLWNFLKFVKHSTTFQVILWLWQNITKQYNFILLTSWTAVLNFLYAFPETTQDRSNDCSIFANSIRFHFWTLCGLNSEKQLNIHIQNINVWNAETKAALNLSVVILTHWVSC